MVKISFVLVLSLMLALPFRTVLGQDSWESMINQAKEAGFSSETLDEAKRAVGGSTLEKGLDKAEADTSPWADIVKNKASSMGLGSPANAPAEEPLLEAEVESSPTEAPENSSTEAPAANAAEPVTAPAQAPLGQAPSASAPEAATPEAQAPTPQTN